jgi:hypothetical protein
MKPLARLLLTLSIVLAAEASGLAGDEPARGAKLQDKLVGTWKLVSAKYGGQEFHFPEGHVMIKHVTPSQFMWVTYDKEGQVTRAAGGSYTLKGETYEELPEYGLSGDFEIIKGKPQTFQCKIEDNTWHHDGKLSNGQTIEEVWERIPKK